MVAPVSMPKGLAMTLRVVDWAMILYWSVVSMAALSLFALPHWAMYDGYGTPIIDAWNWSFAPLDIAFAIAGLASVHFAAKADRRWIPLALVSLALTFCAGLMAISFWAIKGEFNPSWWIPNMMLMLVAIYWIPKLTNIERSTD